MGCGKKKFRNNPLVNNPVVQTSKQGKIQFYINFTDRVVLPVGKIFQFSFKTVIYMSLYSTPSTLKKQDRILEISAF
jgi:hypothetical protein